jgi:uncharacterized protein DUF3237
VFDYNLEHLFSYTVTLDQPEVIGPVSEGIRVNLHITGGEVNGPQVHGKVRPVGADFLTIRLESNRSCLASVNTSGKAAGTFP